MGPGHATCHSRSHLRYSLINSLLLYISSLPRCSSSCVFFLLFKLWVATCWVTAGGIRETKLIKKTGDGDDTALCESFFRSFKSPELISLIQAGRRFIYLFIFVLDFERMLWEEESCGNRKPAFHFQIHCYFGLFTSDLPHTLTLRLCLYLNSVTACVYLL